MYIFTEPKKLTVVKTHEEKVQDTSSKTGVLKSGKTQHYEFEINVPADKTSIENSKIVLRKYVVLIKVVLPVPHQNVLLKIPVQIGDVIREDGLICEVLEQNLEEPPTYWEVMAESKYDTDDDNDDTSHSTKDMNEIK
ncbi:hypothetical protein O0L34_g11632 [Tuta absoluta]|nr:hypothetical protein O0L34_g11632 [Tuta absoluta]